jgi:hypothetical protein
LELAKPRELSCEQMRPGSLSSIANPPQTAFHVFTRRRPAPLCVLIAIEIIKLSFFLLTLYGHH